MRTIRILFAAANLGLAVATMPAAAEDLSPVAVPPASSYTSVQPPRGQASHTTTSTSLDQSGYVREGYDQEGAAIAGAGGR
jgi:hypothetical protein